jgi:hypothetical protein
MAVMTIIGVGLPERQPNQSYNLQTVSGEALPILKEAVLKLTLGRYSLNILVFVANIANEFAPGLDILHTCHASVHLGRQILRLGEDEVSLRSHGARSKGLPVW